MVSLNHIKSIVTETMPDVLNIEITWFDSNKIRYDNGISIEIISPPDSTDRCPMVQQINKYMNSCIVKSETEDDFTKAVSNISVNRAELTQ